MCLCTCWPRAASLPIRPRDVWSAGGVITWLPGLNVYHWPTLLQRAPSKNPPFGKKNNEVKLELVYLALKLTRDSAEAYLHNIYRAFICRSGSLLLFYVWVQMLFTWCDLWRSRLLLHSYTHWSETDLNALCSSCAQFTLSLTLFTSKEKAFIKGSWIFSVHNTIQMTFRL